MSIANQYAEQGFYVHTESVVSPAALERAVVAMDDVRNGTYDTGRPPEDSLWVPGAPLDQLCKIEMPHFASTALTSVIKDSGIGELAARLTGARFVQAWWVQLLIKPSLSNGSVAPSKVGWHQDFQYWDVWEPESELFTAWLALSDVTEESGPMHFVPGSHRWGILDFGNFFEQDLDAQVRAACVPKGEEWVEVSGALPPGGVSFHDKLTLHGSGLNLSGMPRRSLAIHLRTDKSKTCGGANTGLAKYIDDHAACPVIFG